MAILIPINQIEADWTNWRHIKSLVNIKHIYEIVLTRGGIM